MHTRIVFLFGTGVALNPARYHADYERCQQRAGQLIRQYRFVHICTEEADSHGASKYISVRKPDDIDVVCKDRVLLDLVASDPVPGTVSLDLLSRLFESKKLDPDCRFVMVSPVSMRKVRKEPKRLSSPSADDSRSVDGQFVAQGLAGLAALHQRGFVVGCTGDLAPFEEGGVLRLDPARVDPIYLSSGELDLLAVKRVKNELEMFHTAISEVFAFASLVRDFGNWIRRIRVDSRQLPQMAEYRVWIDQFARTMADRKRKEPEPSPSPPVVRDSPIIREFKREMNACMQTFNSLGWEKCVKTSDQLVIESVGEITVREITKGDGGDIWSTSNPNILLKVSKSYRDFCKERSILSVLNGLNGRVPDLYTVIDPKCHMMVMHKVGTKNWPGPLDSERPTNNQVADLIETLRDLHDAGFLHGDLYPRNARIDTEHAYLIDFEMSSLIPESGASVDASRRSDMMRLVGYVFTLNVPRGLEMYADMDVLGDDDRPDYEKWITSYRS